jgi:predicted nucleic acid-binding protein
MPNAFVDTNVLVYAADEVHPSGRKTVVARELLLQPGLHLSVQVVNEFVVNARHPAKLNFSSQQEREWLERWLLFEIAPMTVEICLEALRLHRRFQVSHWDALILASASETRCETLYSEDLAHGPAYGAVTVINPFL